MGKTAPRFFKTKAFNKLAAKARVTDRELLQAGIELTQGKGDELGGNVWKKRLHQNMFRSIVIGQIKEWWFFVYLYAKSDRANIDHGEKIGFKRLADLYRLMSVEQLLDQLEIEELLEIVSDGDEATI